MLVDMIGSETRDVVLMNNNLVSSENIVGADNDVPKETIIAMGNALRDSSEKNSLPEDRPAAK